MAILLFKVVIPAPFVIPAKAGIQRGKLQWESRKNDLACPVKPGNDKSKGFLTHYNNMPGRRLKMVKNKKTLESQWMRGYGRIKHTRETCIRIRSLKNKLEKRNIKGDGIGFYELLMAADRLANAGMGW